MNKKYTKKSFRDATKLTNSFNKIVIWENFKIGTVMWHYNAWKLVNTLDHNLITNFKDKTYIIIEFHTQEELWQHIKKLLTTI